MIRRSTPRRAAFSASNVVTALAVALESIKAEDDLTDADLGAELGRSEDQARKYRRGEAVMDAVTFGRGRRAWGTRFTGDYDLLCDTRLPGEACDRSALTAIVVAGGGISRALEDGAVSAIEAHALQCELLAKIPAVEGRA